MKLLVIDKRGSPLREQIQKVLSAFVPRFRSQFACIRDEAVIADLFDEAGQAIAKREAAKGSIENLHSFAWVVLKNAALSWIRRPGSQFDTRQLQPEDAMALLSQAVALAGSPEQIERDILIRQAFASLTAIETRVCMLKLAGYPSDEIGVAVGLSREAVDTLYSRLRRRIREMYERPNRRITRPKAV